MSQNNYTPRPIDTKDVALPKELTALAEDIAKNVHEVWSEGRMKDGWTYGEERNDADKKHPCLVPYEELSEEEKEYDRNTSVETIKLILKLGFKISRDWCENKAITTKARFGNKENQVSFFYFCLIGFDGLQHLYYKTIRSCARHEQEY